MDCAVASKAGATDSGHLTIVISISDGCKRVGICSPWERRISANELRIGFQPSVSSLKLPMESNRRVRKIP